MSTVSCRTRVDPATVALPAWTLGAEDRAVHGGEQPVAVLVDLGLSNHAR